jgi:hypothetical protein
MLDMRPGCECCDRDLPPDSNDARICTFECTFCAACAERLGRCPNCGGDLVGRPVRPAELLAKYPASTKRVFAPKKCVDAMARLLAVLLFAGASSLALGQEVTVGSTFPYYANVNPTKTQTMISVIYEANTTGFVTTATFGWSSTPCPAAVKIKFFRTLGFGYFNYVTERGPFDVTSPFTPAGTVPPVIQTVPLDPPVALQKGDVIGITNLTTCGGPTWSVVGVPLPGVPPTWSYAVDGDVISGVGPGQTIASTYSLYLYATGPSRGLGLLNGRFEVNLSATDPRTGRTTEGTARSVDDTAGYFGLPDFTGNPNIPEITVKMVDATTAPPPFGGAFWFFHSSLTDVTYTLTVTDHQTGRVRTYSSAGSPAFCGGADTNAFPP